MEHAVCLNTLSLPAQDKESAYHLMLEACYGMLELNAGSDRFSLYFDDMARPIYECLLAENYTYNDFLADLATNQLMDLLLLLEEAEDKSPALDYLNSEQFDELASYQFYLSDAGFNEVMDILGIAWLVDGILLSLATHKRWENTKISISRWDPHAKREDRYFINNIAGVDNGIAIHDEIRASSELTLDDICPQCMYTEEFREWHKRLNENNRHRVVTKIQLAVQKKFFSGEPLFKTLENAGGMRELRFSAYPGGAIRILFGPLLDNVKAILIGFIKKSKTEGYDTNINRAKLLWKDLLEKPELFE